MTNLKQAIERVPSERIALISQDQKVSYADLLKLIKNNQEALIKIKASNVVIKDQSRLLFSKLLILLDSHVNTILFLPSDINSELVNQFYINAQIHYEVYLDNGILKTICLQENSNLNVQSTQWIIPTSGTTNIPKLVIHNFKTLTRTSKTDTKYGDKYIWGLVFDIYRFSGLQVLLQSILAGSTLIISEAPDSMSELLKSFHRHNCNALSATPSFWRKAMMSQEINNLNLDVITLGGEIADNTILNALRTRFPKAKISHIYASTEAGVGFSVNDGQEGFPKNYINQNKDGLTLKISNKNTLLIKNDKQEQTYMSNSPLSRKDGFIDTEDIVEVKNERVYFLGRDSGAINVGGNKVQPEEVEKILLNLNLVNAIYVYSKKNPMMGNLVCADIVLNTKNQDVKKAKVDILKYAREKLDNFKVPAIIKFVDQLEVTHSGKLKRN